MSDRSFFVGYRPVPSSIRRFMMVAIPLLLIAGVLASWAVSRGQATVGVGVWPIG